MKLFQIQWCAKQYPNGDSELSSQEEFLDAPSYVEGVNFFDAFKKLEINCNYRFIEVVGLNISYQNINILK